MDASTSDSNIKKNGNVVKTISIPTRESDYDRERTADSSFSSVSTTETNEHHKKGNKTNALGGNFILKLIDSAKKFYYAPNTQNYVQKLQRWTELWLKFTRTTLRSLYLPDDVHLYSDYIIRAIFSLYVLPFLVVIVALTHAALQRLVWVFLVPVTHTMERNPYPISSFRILIAGIFDIWFKIAPFITLGLSIATVGHKMLSCLLEALIDANSTYKQQDYPLLRMRFHFMTKTKARFMVFLGVFVASSLLAILMLYTNYLITWSSGYSFETYTMWIIIFIEVVFVFLTVVHGAPQDLLSGVAKGTFASPTKKRATPLLGNRSQTVGGGNKLMPIVDFALQNISADPPSTGRSASSRVNEDDSHPKLTLGEEHRSRGAVAESSNSGGSNVGGNYDREDSNFSIVGTPKRRGRADGNLRSSDSLWGRNYKRSHSPLFGDSPSNNRSMFGAKSSDGVYHRGPLRGAEKNSSRTNANRSGSQTYYSREEEEDDDDEEDYHDAFNFFVYIEDNWWEDNVHLMRYIGFLSAVGLAVLIGVFRGLTSGITSLVMTLMYLNVPHLFGYTVLSASAGIVNCIRSIYWLYRHIDALSPVLILLIPYQIVFFYSYYYFRHHALTILSIIPVNVLLITRTIDLVREYDVSAQGIVRWYDESGNIIPTTLAVILEDSYEREHETVDVVSLDISIDLKNMQICYSDGRTMMLRRVQVIPYGSAKYYAESRDFYVYVLPKLLSFQSGGYVSSDRFGTARVILRGITFTFFIIFAIIVGGMIVQSAFPSLRPLPVRVEMGENNTRLTLNHIVVKLDLISEFYSMNSNGTCGIDQAPATTPSQWDRIKSDDDDDFYPQLCTRDYFNTSVFELSLLSAASYLFDKDEIETLLHFMNVHLASDWKLRERHGTSCRHGDSNHQPTNWRGFFDFYSASRNLSVIAVRGTDLSSFADFLIDINLFFEPVLYQLLTNIIPGSVLVPEELVADLIRLVSIPPPDTIYDEYPNRKGGKGSDGRETWKHLTETKNESLRFCRQNNYQRDFFADVYNHIVYVGSRAAEQRPEHLLLTGHSLGGAVASVLAAQLEIPAVAFSAPGIILARKKFNADLLMLNKYVMTVKQSNDIVPLLGSQGGEVQHLKCRAQTKDICHAMELIIGSIWRSCGSIRRRFSALKDVS